MSQNFGFVILSYNHPEITRKCVQSLLDKGVSASSILLFHNGSEKKWLDLLKVEFPKIFHAQNGKNCGFSGGANSALQRAFQNWDWVYFMTNDTQLLKFSAPLDLVPGFYAPPVWHRKGQNLDSWGGFLDLQRGRLRHAHVADETPRSHEFFYVPGTAFVIHKDFFFRNGGFKEKLHTFWEDVELSVRALRQGETVSRTDVFEVLHLGGKTCHKSSDYTLYLYQRNRWLVSFSQANFSQTIFLSFYFLKENLRIFFNLIQQSRWADLKKYLRGQKDFFAMSTKK